MLNSNNRQIVYFKLFLIFCVLQIVNSTPFYNRKVSTNNEIDSTHLLNLKKVVLNPFKNNHDETNDKIELNENDSSDKRSLSFIDSNGKIQRIPHWESVEYDNNESYNFSKPILDIDAYLLKKNLVTIKKQQNMFTNFFSFKPLKKLFASKDDDEEDEEDDDDDDETSSELSLELNPIGNSLGKASKHVTLELFSRENPDDPIEVTPIDSKDAPVDFKKITKVVIHGYMENGDRKWMKVVKNNFLEKGNFNVITVNWFFLLSLDYIKAVKSASSIGNYIGSTLALLVQTGKIDVKQIHLIGFSLGAHIAGFAGKTIKAQTGQTVGWITGLDPARPLFESPFLVDENKRLSKNDADFVDIVHANGKWLGFKESLGHVDFYPNGGYGIQPGCGILTNVVCSHLRAYAFYEESIESQKFVAKKCNTWRKFKRGECDNTESNIMGYYVNKTLTGDYFLHTNKRSPFAKG